MQRADKIIVGALAFGVAYGLLLLPLFPLLAKDHPALLEFIRGSSASIINMGARARIGDTTLAEAVLLAVPTLMKLDWVFWWAGRRWGDRVYVYILGGETPKTRKRLERMHRIERRFGALAVVLAYVLPIPSALVYAAVGDGGMRLWVFLVLDLLGTILWSGLMAVLGYEIGRPAIDVVDAIDRYALWATLGLFVLVFTYQYVKAVRGGGR